jgi:hypothetical protein
MGMGSICNMLRFVETSEQPTTDRVRSDLKKEATTIVHANRPHERTETSLNPIDKEISFPVNMAQSDVPRSVVDDQFY